MTQAARLALEPLCRTDDPVLSAVARAFSDCLAALACSEGDKDTALVRERLAMLAVRGEGLWHARIHAALVEVDRALLAAKTIAGPMACRYAPMLAALEALKVEERVNEALRRSNAARSPIVLIARKTLLAAPVGPLGDTGLPLFLDRLIAEVGGARARHVKLRLIGLDAVERDRLIASRLHEELAALRCTLELF